MCKFCNWVKKPIIRMINAVRVKSVIKRETKNRKIAKMQFDGVNDDLIMITIEFVDGNGVSLFYNPLTAFDDIKQIRLPKRY